MSVNLYNDDCRKVLKELLTESVDLIVTSPPYDDLRTYNNSSSWNFEIFKDIANEIFRILKVGGVCVWIVNDQVINGTETGTSFRQALYFKEIGFNIHDTMIWKKTNPLPQIKQSRYTQVFEYMFIFSKGKPKTFNPIMIPCKFAGLKTNGLAKQISKDKIRVKKELITKDEKIEYNIWEMNVSQNKTNHPAVFPLELAIKHINSWSNPGDTVLDPFMGSGTTGIASIKLNRNFIGIEIDKEYFNFAKKLIDNQNKNILF